MKFRRLIAVAAAAAAIPMGMAAAEEMSPKPAKTVPTGCVTPTRSMNLYAEELPRTAEGEIRLGWGLASGKASIPGPPIEMTEGECLQITVVNNVAAATFEELRANYPVPPGEHSTPLGVSLHVHGVKYTQDSDGTAHSGSWVPPGQSRTYTWYAAPRVTVADRVVSLGTAGTWWYHDHVAGTSHGTGGLDSGLFGALVVRRPGDLKPDHHYTVVMGQRQSINFRRFPESFTCDTDSDPNTCFQAEEGDRVEFSVLNVGDEFHTFHLHGHVWADNRTGILSSELDSEQLIDAKTIGPSETFGFQLIAGEEVGPGDWMLHCHVQAHSDLGMVTFFRVNPKGGALPTLDNAITQGHHH